MKKLYSYFLKFSLICTRVFFLYGSRFLIIYNLKNLSMFIRLFEFTDKIKHKKSIFKGLAAFK